MHLINGDRIDDDDDDDDEKQTCLPYTSELVLLGHVSIQWCALATWLTLATQI